ncbi:hypothetical protein, partial [Pantoea anthophila]|uniref:hypothetical protein n=1 Tax=Pantoea anthophila TaxID=470931 RepID=UPI00289C00B3
MKILTQTLLASSLTAALWLTPAGAETPAAVDNSGVAPVNSSAPTPPGAAPITPSAAPGTDSAQVPVSETPPAAAAGNS